MLPMSEGPAVGTHAAAARFGARQGIVRIVFGLSRPRAAPAVRGAAACRRMDATSQPTGPLAGLKVVEMAGIGPAPFVAMVLADLGADVIRVDRPGGPGLQVTAPAYDVLNRGRRNVCLDLKRPEARDVVLDLVARADVLVEGFRPGVMERLGLGPQECAARNERLVYARMTGWGQDGPLAQRAGHDIAYVALTGALHATGRAGGPAPGAANPAGHFRGGGVTCLVGSRAAPPERTAR